MSISTLLPTGYPWFLSKTRNNNLKAKAMWLYPLEDSSLPIERTFFNTPLSKMSSNSNSNQTQNSNSSGASLPDITDNTAAVPVDDTAVSTFVDNMAISTTTTVPSQYIPYPMNDSSLQEYFSRPVLISTISLQVAGATNTLQPYLLWRNNAIVLRKLIGYKNFRGNMVLKYVYSTNAYTYGLVTCSVFYTSNAFAVSDTTVFNRYRQTQAASVTYLELNKGNSELQKIPFVYPAPFLNVSETATASTGFGNICTLIVSNTEGIKRADQVAALPIRLSVYAWMEDVVLDVPTSYVALSAMGETAKPIKISSVARAVGDAASTLTKFPIIGGIASTVSSVANTVASVAAFFGFSKPDGGYTVDTMVLRPIGNLSLTNIVDTSARMSLFKEQSNSLSNAYLAGGDEDPLLVKNIAGKYSLLHVQNWASSTVATTNIFRFPVNPTLCTAPLATNTFQPTNLGYVAGLYNDWSGSIVYRIKFVCTSFHRGKIMIWYTPESSLNPIGDDPTNTTRNFILDLNEGTDIEFAVPMCSRHGTLRVPSLGSQLVYDTRNSNGSIYMRVVEPLVGNDGATNIYAYIFVKAGADFSLSNPTSLPYSQPNDSAVTTGNLYRAVVYPYAVQLTRETGFSISAPSHRVIELIPPRYDPTPIMDLHHGETSASLRNLLTRYTLRSISSASRNGTAANFAAFFTWAFTNEPASAALNSLGTAASSRYTNSAYTRNPGQYYNDNLHYILNAFVGYRGSFRHKIVTLNGILDGHVTMFIKRDYTHAPVSKNTACYPNTTAVDVASPATISFDVSRWAANAFYGIYNGFAPTEVFVDNAEFTIPFTDMALYHQCNYIPPTTASIASATDSTRIVCWIQQNSTIQALRNILFAHFISAGDDLSVHVYQGPLPIVYWTSIDSTKGPWEELTDQLQDVATS